MLFVKRWPFYLSLNMLILMLTQGSDYKSKGDKLSSSGETRIRNWVSQKPTLLQHISNSGGRKWKHIFDHPSRLRAGYKHWQKQTKITEITHFWHGRSYWNCTQKQSEIEYVILLSVTVSNTLCVQFVNCKIVISVIFLCSGRFCTLLTTNYITHHWRFPPIQCHPYLTWVTVTLGQGHSQGQSVPHNLGLRPPLSRGHDPCCDQDFPHWGQSWKVKKNTVKSLV